MKTLSLTVFNHHVRFQCQDAETHALLMTNFGHLKSFPMYADLTYTIGRQKESNTFCIRKEGQCPLLAPDTGTFFFLLEKDMLIELQKLRHDLFFIHSAVVEFAGKACMLVAPSGSGKSTTTWALLHHGFRYLSDELGAVDVQTLEVYPYLHALCLKNEPPGPYLLPKQAFATSHTLLIPTDALPGGLCSDPITLATILFIRYCPEASGASIRPLSSAAGGARLFANTLNSLAHPGYGLDGAIAIATRSACFELLTADLPSTCALVKTTLASQAG